MTTGVRASHGFEALGEFDVDHDGKITAADPIFHELVLWSDHDSDRRGALGELVPVAQAELIAIDLGFGRRYDCDERGNCGVERRAQSGMTQPSQNIELGQETRGPGFGGVLRGS